MEIAMAGCVAGGGGPVGGCADEAQIAVRRSMRREQAFYA